MSVAVATAAPRSEARARIAGVAFLAVGLAMAWLFGAGSAGEGSASFGLNGPGQLADLPPLRLPASGTAYLLSVVCMFLGGIQLSRGFGTKLPLIGGVVAGLFVIAFLTWAARGSSLNLYGMLQSTLLRSVPLTLGALSGVLCERSGVINIAIEGMMLTAAFAGAMVASAAGNLLIGTGAAAAAGALLGAALAVLAIRYRVDQIVAGTVLNIFALGMTSYLTARILVSYPDLNSPGTFSPIAVPLLSKIPLVGPLLFRNNVFVFLTFVLIAIVWVGLFRTRWGLRVRAVGEHPHAAETVGVNVLRVRYRNVILGGAVAGLAGAYLTLGAVGRFDENMTAGKGFIALAAMIFGRWNPIGAFGAALVFGFADSLQNKLAILNVPIPSEFLAMAPYLATILVVAGVVGRARPPAADGQPYSKE
ncbi:MAG TPA: ABC transporter permease [Actinomycetota bacterium]|jgi:general nucleoside transport system permease protein|nr:ABC transporter permease [Actinomycetota bacterium]